MEVSGERKLVRCEAGAVDAVSCSLEERTGNGGRREPWCMAAHDVGVHVDSFGSVELFLFLK
jgi:hypothetical protein